MPLLGKLINGLVKTTPTIYNAVTNRLKSSQLNPPKLCTNSTTFQNRLFSSEKAFRLYNKVFQRKTVTFTLPEKKSSSRMLSTCIQPFMDPRGKVAIVTGGMRGIGLCMVEELLCLEAKVIIMDVDKEVGECAIERLNRIYGKDNASFLKGDVTSCESFEESFAQALCRYNRVDILVNNAGILQPQNWKNTIKINFSGVVNGIHLGLKYMGANCGKQGGIIINIASIVGKIPLGGAPVYSATKHGVIALTLGYADGFHYDKTRVRLCAICPGVTETSMIQVNNLDMDVQQRELLACQLGSLPSQPPERLGPAVSHVVREGPNGSIWISENNELYQIQMADYRDLECPGTRFPKIRC